MNYILLYITIEQINLNKNKYFLWPKSVFNLTILAFMEKRLDAMVSTPLPAGSCFAVKSAESHLFDRLTPFYPVNAICLKS